MKDVYEIYKVKRVINASGKMTILGGSRVANEVSDACRVGAANFFEVKDLLDKTGAYIANLLQVEDSYIVSSATSGIAQCVAASIAGEDFYKILHLHAQPFDRNEIVLAKGHNVDFGVPIEVAIQMGGGCVVEAGYANSCLAEHVESCITDRTAALFYVKSHHCVQKNMITIATMKDIAKAHNLPLIIDAAAEEDLRTYYEQGGDAVIYSGTKALAGPTSGLIVGRRDFLSHVKAQSKGIGRIMKVGKESILGLVKAIEIYVEQPSRSLLQQETRFATFHEKMNKLLGITCRCIQDSAGREIIRSEVTFHKDCLISAKIASQKLKEGELRIYTRDYRANIGILEIDIRDVSDEELLLIYDKLKQILEEN